MIANYTALTLVIGFIVDAFLGDPQTLPHPVQFFGWMITTGEKPLRSRAQTNRQLYVGGMVLSLLVMAAGVLIPALLLLLAYKVSFFVWFVAECVMSWQLLAARSLQKESMRVHAALQQGNISLARESVGRIVGRDTANLSEQEIIKATVETIAENTADGVAAPMFYAAIGGAPIGFLYKAVNTLDSMIGYKNNTYKNFGTFAARTDDIFNFVPARLSAVIMIVAAFLLRMDYKNAWQVFVKDRYNHASPNSAQTEAVAAGALQIQLAGNSIYFGKLIEKPTIGKAIRTPTIDDIARTNRLMYATSVLLLIVLTAIKCAIVFSLIGVRL